MRSGIIVGGVLGFLALTMAFGCGDATKRAHRCRCVGVGSSGRLFEYAKMCPSVMPSETCVDLDDPQALARERAE